MLGYYINLLKTVSLKLNSSTVQFFYQDDGEHAAFPLYTEAVKFINHRDGMARPPGAACTRLDRCSACCMVCADAHALKAQLVHVAW